MVEFWISIGTFVAIFLASVLKVFVAFNVSDVELSKKDRYKAIAGVFIKSVLVYTALGFHDRAGLLYVVCRISSIIVHILLVRMIVKKDVLKIFCMDYSIVLLNIPALIIISTYANESLKVIQFAEPVLAIITTSLVYLFLIKRPDSSVSRTLKWGISRLAYLCSGLILFGEAVFIYQILFVDSFEFSNYEGFSLGFFVFITTVLLVMFFILLVRERKQSEAIKNQAALLNTYTETIEHLYDDIRSYKHDISNILLSLKYYLDEKDLEAVDRVFKEEIEGIKGFDIDVYKVLTQLKKLEIDVLKGLIIAKYQRALEEGVQLELGIDGIVSNSSVNGVDLCRIVGIYLDNAIEAARETEGKQVLLYMSKTQEGALIKISNDYNADQPLIIVAKKNSTTKGKGRGMGLYSAQRIIKTNKNLAVETKLENEFYTQVVYLTH